MNVKARFVLAAAVVAASCGVAARPAHAIITNVALGKPTSGDVAFGFPTSNAVDGNTGNITHSNNVGSVFWQVDFTSAYNVMTVELVNRGDGCCPERLNGATLSVLDSALAPIFTSAPIAGAGVGQVLTFDNGGLGFPGAQYVRVNHANQYLSIAELRAIADVAPPSYGNLAQIFGTATQSTTGYGLPASGAIDGNRTGNSISHTADGDMTPSLAVDLGNLYRIEEIGVYTRDNCCTAPPSNSPERDYNLTVEVLDGDGNVVYTHPVYNPWDGVDPAGSAPVVGLGASFTIDLGPGIVGKSVRVSKVSLGGSPHSEWLSIAELEVYGSTTAVPEPSSVCLAALGLVGGLLVVRRGRK